MGNQLQQSKELIDADAIWLLLFSLSLVNITGTNIFLYFMGNQLQQSKELIDADAIWLLLLT